MRRGAILRFKPGSGKEAEHERRRPQRLSILETEKLRRESRHPSQIQDETVLVRIALSSRPLAVRLAAVDQLKSFGVMDWWFALLKPPTSDPARFLYEIAETIDRKHCSPGDKIVLEAAYAARKEVGLAWKVYFLSFVRRREEAKANNEPEYLAWKQGFDHYLKTQSVWCLDGQGNYVAIPIKRTPAVSEP